VQLCDSQRWQRHIHDWDLAHLLAPKARHRQLELHFPTVGTRSGPTENELDDHLSNLRPLLRITFFGSPFAFVLQQQNNQNGAQGQAEVSSHCAEHALTF
jgi:hypothetical protein